MWDKPEALNLIANLLYAVAFLLALYAGVMVVAQLSVFPLRELRVLGEPKLTAPADLEALVARELRGNFFTLDLARARKAFETLPWVRKADLRRHWPDRLEVRLEEHVPLARWGAIGLVSTQGEVFSASYEGELPVFAGPAGSAKEMAIQYAYFRKSLEPLGRVPTRVSVTARRAWTLQLDSGLTLELGRAEPEDRLARFVQNYGQAAALLGRRMQHVDLRYSNGFAVRVPELARAEAKEKRK
jgi:cell division protein FtsQ